MFSNFSKIIFWTLTTVQKYSLRKSRTFENLGDVDLFCATCWNSEKISKNCEFGPYLQKINKKWRALEHDLFFRLFFSLFFLFLIQTFFFKNRATRLRCKLLHRSAFKNSAKFRQTFSHFYSLVFEISLIFRNFCPNLTNFDEFFPEFQQICWKRSTSPRFSNFLRFRTENCWNVQIMAVEKLEKLEKLEHNPF